MIRMEMSEENGLHTVGRQTGSRELSFNVCTCIEEKYALSHHDSSRRAGSTRVRNRRAGPERDDRYAVNR
jgi:hypothetical protein